MDTINDLEARYGILCEEYSNRYPITTSKWVLEHRDIHEEMLQLEREIALRKGIATALPMDWPRVDHYSMHQTPLLLANEIRTLLLYTTYAPMQDDNDPISTSDEKPWFVLLEFLACAAAKIGPPNDEVFEGHPLYGRGIDIGGAHVVINSDWKQELMRINQVHSQYNAARWEAKNHYLWFFKESTFEAIASKIIERMVSDDLGSLQVLAAQLLME